jgi:hypothetical protein
VKTIAAWVCLVVLSACVAVGEPYKAAPEPKDTDALVYIYRFGGAYSGRSAYFYVNDVNVADLDKSGYTWFHVPAGEYRIKQKWPIDVDLRSLELTETWLPGKKYYYRFDTAGALAPALVSGKLGLALKIDWQLSRVSAEEAVSEIGTTKLQPAFGAEKLLQTTRGSK